jgi:IS5 family transposase
MIGHLKTDYRMQENYLWGEQGVQINAYWQQQHGI